MTKSEWASWAQAIGAIVALLVAVGIAWKSRKDIKRDAYWELNYSLIQACSAYKLIIDACSNQDEKMIINALNLIRDVKARISQMPIALLDPMLLLVFAGLRMSVTNYLHDTPERGPWRWSNLAHFTEESLRILKGMFPQLADNRPGLKGWLRRSIKKLFAMIN